LSLCVSLYLSLPLFPPIICLSLSCPPCSSSSLPLFSYLSFMPLSLPSLLLSDLTLSLSLSLSLFLSLSLSLSLSLALPTQCRWSLHLHLRNGIRSRYRNQFDAWQEC